MKKLKIGMRVKVITDDGDCFNGMSGRIIKTSNFSDHYSILLETPLRPDNNILYGFKERELVGIKGIDCPEYLK